MKNFQKTNTVRDKSIINLKLVNKWSNEKIGRKKNITAERVRQILNKYVKSQVPQSKKDIN